MIFVIACAMGLAFAAVSTFDFAQHLDRQVHDLHCSFIPGQRTNSIDGEAVGCQVTLMSPYSSVLRASVWGGVPISLPAMGVFAFLAFRGIDTLGRRGTARRRSAAWLFVFSFVPLLASIVMGFIALLELEAACKVCIGIYAASLVVVLAAGLAYASCRRLSDDDEPGAAPTPSNGVWAMVGLAQLGAFVFIPVLAYIGMMPDYSRYIGTCGKLPDTSDPGGVMVPLDQNSTGTLAVEVFDPLCPACKAFDKRLAASGLDAKIQRRAVLFPLDDTCNWMVEGAVHPGACTVSEAILCADAAKGNGPTANMVIEWAFEAQDSIRAAAKTDATAAKRMIGERFPDLAACVGTAEVQQRLNKSLRWAVAHSIPVLTPQLYVGGTKLCPEDTDLGLEYSLTGLLEKPSSVGGTP